MKFAPQKHSCWLRISTVAVSLLIGATKTGAMELDYLQDDSRFTGGEYNTSDPTHPNFWFYDQYTNARNALQNDGMALVPVTTITLPNLNADSDAFYIPTPANTSASTYPMTSTELSTIQQYVGQGHSVIFDLNGSATGAAQLNNLLSRLGLGGTADGTVNGNTNYPLGKQPIITGVIPTGGVDGNVGVGSVGSFSWSGVGNVSGGNLRSLVAVNGANVLPYVEKGDLSSTSGAYFFLLDNGQSFMNFTSTPAAEQKLMVNMLEYATTDQYLHFIPPTKVAATPEPGSLLILGAASMGLLVRCRRED